MAEPRTLPWWRRWPLRAWHCLAGGGWLAALCRIVVVSALFGLGALMFVAAGLVPIAASDGHWAATRGLLQFAMERSVRTSAMGLKAPSLDDPALVLKGAGHYASSCLPCHGAPGQPRALVVTGMTPEPPFLPDGTGTLRDEDLFWIVRHGIKYTAMPAWPAQVRKDEVWAMVAFLRAQPGMDAERFRALAYGEAPAPGGGGDHAHTGDDAGAGARVGTLAVPLEPVLADCARCHGADGLGRGAGAFPRLAGLDAAYLEASLDAFARGARHSGFMQPVAHGLSRAQRRALARHFAALPVTEAAPACRDPAAFERGAALANAGNARHRIPACAACHEGTGRNPLYPTLSGQPARYLALQLTLFRDGHRGGTAYAHVMRAAARHLEDAQIQDLAAYYAALPTGCPGG